jgi:hypothetical protein
LKTHDSEADGYAVEFTDKENAILSQIEDVSDSIQRDARSGKKGSVDIAFFDVSEMSGLTQLFYLSAIFGFIGFTMYYFWDKMVVGPEAE